MNHELKVVNIRLVKEPSWYSKEPMTSPEKVIARLGEEFRDYDREVFGVLNLASDNRILCLNIVSVGILNASLVSPREVFKSSILSNAASIIGFHNHVSGNCYPSKEDILVTEKLKKAGEYLDIPLLDHVILGREPGVYYSFKEEQLLGTNAKEVVFPSLDEQIADALNSKIKNDRWIDKNHYKKDVIERSHC